jgi:dihydroflavonol-4-reductase
MKALVTGATGFIGGNIARELVRQGYKVKALVRKDSNIKYLQTAGLELIEGDLLIPASLEKALEGCDYLFHAAALYTFWARNPKLIYQTNVRGTENILKAAAAKVIKKIVYTSSESVVGIDSGCRVGKEEMQNCIERIPSDYKKSKFMAESLVFKMSGEGLPVVIVNPTTPVGPYDIKPTPTGNIVLEYLKHRMSACVNTGLNVVDVEDVAKGHILALEKGSTGARYLLGNKNLTLREILTILEKITGIKAPGITIPTWCALGAGYVDEFFEGKILRRSPRIPVSAVKASMHYRHFDCSKAVKELGMPQTPVEISFKKAVDWFRENGYVKN